MVKIQLNLNVKSVRIKENVKMVIISAHNVNMPYMINAQLKNNYFQKKKSKKFAKKHIINIFFPVQSVKWKRTKKTRIKVYKQFNQKIL